MKIELTEHPSWVQDLLSTVAPEVDRIVNGPFFNYMAEGTLSMNCFRGGLLNFYPLVENFPKYMAFSLTRVPRGSDARNDCAYHVGE